MLFKASFAAMASLLILMTTVRTKMHMAVPIMIAIEVICMCALATAFATALGLALSLNNFSVGRLKTNTTTDLSKYAILVTLTKSYVILSGAACFIVLTTCITATADACGRARAKETCSFEPTASALGMGHSYPDIVPQVPRSRVPTMYDPGRNVNISRNSGIMEVDDDEKGLASNGGQVARRDSGISEYVRDSAEFEKEIIGPLNLERPETVLQIRPPRPWSEAPTKSSRDASKHAI